MTGKKAAFTEGSIMRHIVVMAFTGSIGLTAIFLVDLVDMFFLSLLGQVALAAAIGYAGTLLFFGTSISIGITIGVTALVARAIGAGHRDDTERLAASGLIYTLLASLLITGAFLALLDTALDLLGAAGEARELAKDYLHILIPATPLLSLGMVLSGLLRAAGDAKRAMYVTLSGGLVNAVLDPIFIFGLDMGVEGAATASVFARAAMLAVGVWGVWHVHQMFEKGAFRRALPSFALDTRALSVIAVPAMLTNVATPVGNSYVTASISEFGDGAVAGWAIVGRVVPVVFAIIFALSGAIGPIISQNLGAGHFDRVREAFRASLVFTLGYIMVVWLLLYLANPLIISIFSASGDSAEIITVFTHFIAISYLFNGALFVANASFNNLGKANWSTVLNWGKATIGTIPFVAVGAAWFGAPGVLYGQAVGSAIFGVIAAVACFAFMRQLETTKIAKVAANYQRRAQSAFSSGKAAMILGDEGYDEARDAPTGETGKDGKAQ